MTRLMPSELRENQLIACARTGDVHALSVLFDRYATGIHALAFRLLGSADDADDVVQDVFVGLPTILSRYADEGRFEAWLRQVAARTALMRLRGDRRRQTRALAATPTEQTASAVPSDPALASALNQAILALPPIMRAVFVLRMIEERDYDAIGRVLDLSVGACKVHVHRALKRLRPQLQHLREESNA